MRQDKFVELRIAQLHWNAVPRLAFRHLDPESIEILADSPHIDKKADLQRLSDNFTCQKNLQPVDRKDHVEVLDLAKQFGLAVFKPLRAGKRLTLGTMPIPARVEGDALMATRVAPFDMATQCSRAA
jgi:hypothetical protein